MRMTIRLANTIADVYLALRAADFDQAAAARIITLESDYQIGLILEAKRHGQRRDDPDASGGIPARDQSQGVG